jgi:hypothetical protein
MHTCVSIGLDQHFVPCINDAHGKLLSLEERMYDCELDRYVSPAYMYDCAGKTVRETQHLHRNHL